MIPGLLRYFRRLWRVGRGRFSRDEGGSVLVMTVIFALPLAYFTFVTYNTGIAVLTRMRAQSVADAASYTAALWQSRFYNFCAYSRRQILGNYATMALCTAYESSLKLYIDIYDTNGLTILPFGAWGDEGDVTSGMEMFYTFLGPAGIESSDEFNDNDSMNPVLVVRHGADAMNYMLANAQFAMALSLMNGNAIMKKVVQDADRKAAAGGTGMEFRLVDTGGGVVPLPVPDSSYSSVFYSMSGTQMIEQRKVTKTEVEYYCDNFTLANWLGGFSPLNAGFLGRAPFLGMFGFSSSECEVCDDEKILFIVTWSEGVDISDSGDSMNSTDGCAGFYQYFYCCFEEFAIGMYGVITGPGLMPDPEESDYDVKHDFEATKTYMFKDGLANDDLEPSSLAIVEAVNHMQPFFMQDKGLGRDVSPDELNKADTSHPDWSIRAYSRAKSYFRGPHENMAGYVIDKPSLLYARWGAKLAALEGYNPTRDRYVRQKKIHY